MPKRPGLQTRLDPASILLKTRRVKTGETRLLPDRAVTAEGTSEV